MQDKRMHFLHPLSHFCGAHAGHKIPESSHLNFLDHLRPIGTAGECGDLFILHPPTRPKRPRRLSVRLLTDGHQGL